MAKSFCFLSNYLTHHQLPFCLNMLKLTDGNFTFVETEPFPQERLDLGYVSLGEQHDFVVSAFRSQDARERALKAALSADVTIIGSAPESFIKQRLKEDKLTFRYSERIFKKVNFDILRQLKYALKTLPNRHKNLYYLFSSAYAPRDYERCGAMTDKMFKWGYFPQSVKYDVPKLFEAKVSGTILWVGRFLDLKHPEDAVMVARRLKEEGFSFSLSMVGVGPKQEEIRRQIIEYGLEDCIHLLGAMPTEQVRALMEKSEIYMFTSDFNEGWGAVVNEAMNSGCAVVSSHAAGSVPFLIKQGQNGFVYENCDTESLYNYVKNLLLDEQLCKKIGNNAYESINQVWNAQDAAARLYEWCGLFLQDGIASSYKDGPMSAAQPISQSNMFKYYYVEK